MITAPTKLLRLLAFLGKAAGLGLTIAGPPSLRTPIGLTVFAAASLLKDAVNHFRRPRRRRQTQRLA